MMIRTMAIGRVGADRFELLEVAQVSIKYVGRTLAADKFEGLAQASNDVRFLNRWLR